MPYLLTDTTLNGAFSNYQQQRFLSCARPLEERVSFKATAYQANLFRPPNEFSQGRYCEFLDNGGSEYQGKFDLNAARKSMPIALRYTSHHPHEHPPFINLPRSCEAAPHNPICDATDVPDEFFDRIG